MNKGLGFRLVMLVAMGLVSGLSMAQDGPAAAATTAPVVSEAISHEWPDALRAEAATLEASAHEEGAPLTDMPKVLALGDTGPAVVALAQKLKARGFLDFEEAFVYDHFDGPMVEAVNRAEAAYGLHQDGKAGDQVYLNLNRSPASTATALREWADAVQAALDQVRSSGATHLVIVNIPSFQLHLLDVQTGRQLLESRVIVGMNTRRTPRYLTNIINLKYNPDWNPPPSLVARGRVYVPPGIKNPLGLLRFSTDNSDNIYLHDTDEHELFERPNRARSSGCVRVQQWHALAELLSDQTPEEIDAHLASGKTSYQKIPRTPVMLNYSLVDQVEGRVGVYPDVYAQGDQAIGAAALK